MSYKIIIIMPSRPSQLRFSAESVFSELSRPTRDSDSSRSGLKRIRLGRLISDSAESLNRGYKSTNGNISRLGKLYFEMNVSNVKANS